MAVLKQTSPTAWPAEPRPTPSSTVPSASTSRAVAGGSVQPSMSCLAVSCLAVIGGLHSREPPHGQKEYDNGPGPQVLERGPHFCGRSRPRAPILRRYPGAARDRRHL